MGKFGKFLLFVLIVAFAVAVFLFRSELPEQSSELSLVGDDSSLLYLVNKEYMLAEDDEDEFESVSAFHVVSLARSDIELEPTALYALDDWFEAAEAKGFNGLYCTSGKRTAEYQKKLYDESADKSYVQPPGASEHQTGLAADLASSEVNWLSMGDSELGKWLEESCADFGFILRYPEDKIEITGISYEPWHFRYVGFPHAAFMQENQLCFEEYHEYLEENTQYEYEIGNVKYLVYYLEQKSDMIPVLTDSYEVSGNNKGGFIITEIIE